MSELLLSPQRPPGCPEIELELVAPGVDLDADAARFGNRTPYWAFAWASGVALARWLFDEPERVRGRRVIDLGCGSGIAAIAAAMAGARESYACDWDDEARGASARNATRNGVALEVQRDLPDFEPGDVLVAADVCYEPSAVDVLRAAWEEGGIAVLLADPERRGAPDIPGLLRHGRSEFPTYPALDEATRGATLFRLGC